MPSGNTEFEFTAADMSFESLSYEWLVVAGKRGVPLYSLETTGVERREKEG